MPPYRGHFIPTAKYNHKNNQNMSKIVLKRLGEFFFVNGINTYFLCKTLCNAKKKGQNDPF